MDEIEKMKSLINSRDVYKKYFIESPYIKTQSEHIDVGHPYKCPVAVYVDCFKFPQGYVKDNFLEAFSLRAITHGLRETVLSFEYKFEACAKWFCASNTNLKLARKENHIWKQVMLIE